MPNACTNLYRLLTQTIGTSGNSRAAENHAGAKLCPVLPRKWSNTCNRRVTLLVLPSPGLIAQTVLLDFSVNRLLPLRSAALLTECGQLERRAGALIMLVRRWVKGRGIGQVSMGHVPLRMYRLLSRWHSWSEVTSSGDRLQGVRAARVAEFG